MKQILITESQFNMLMKASLLNEAFKIDMATIGSKDAEAINAKKRAQNGVGTLGHLTPNNPNIVDFNKVISQDWDGGHAELHRAYQNYEKSMNIRRNGMATREGTFANYAKETGYAFQYKGSYILGNFGNGYFKVSHFSPNSEREGAMAIKELVKYDNVIFMVTDDLAPMLYKLGCYFDKDVLVPAEFKGKFLAKQVCTTDGDLFNFIENYYKKQSNVGSLMDAMSRYEEYKKDHKLKLSDLKYLPKRKQYQDFAKKVKDANHDMSKIIPEIPGNKLSPEACEIINDLISYFRNKYDTSTQVDTTQKVKDFMANREIPTSIKDKILNYLYKFVG